MADPNALPTHLREHAAKVPADIVARLTAGELRARCEHAHQHVSSADSHTDPAIFRHLHQHARKVLTAMPAAELVYECKRAQRPGSRVIQPATSGRGPAHLLIRGAVLQKRRAIDDHLMPPGPTGAIESCLLGKGTGHSTTWTSWHSPASEPPCGEPDLADALRAAGYLAEVLAAQSRYRQSVDDLAELGIAASPADAMAWQSILI